MRIGIDHYDLLLGRPCPVEGRASWHIGLEPREGQFNWQCPECLVIVGHWDDPKDRVNARLRGHYLRSHVWA